MDALIVANYAAVILVLLVINSGSSEVRSLDSELLLIDRHEGRLRNRNWRCAVRIVRVRALIDLVFIVIRVGVLWVCPRSNFCTQFRIPILEVLGFTLCLLQEGFAGSDRLLQGGHRDTQLFKLSLQSRLAHLQRA